MQLYSGWSLEAPSSAHKDSLSFLEPWSPSLPLQMVLLEKTSCLPFPDISLSCKVPGYTDALPAGANSGKCRPMQKQQYSYSFTTETMSRMPSCPDTAPRQKSDFRLIIPWL